MTITRRYVLVVLAVLALWLLVGLAWVQQQARAHALAELDERIAQHQRMAQGVLTGALRSGDASQVAAGLDLLLAHPDVVRVRLLAGGGTPEQIRERADSVYDFLRDAIRRSGVAPEMLCFEITEAAAIGNLDRSVRFMAVIRAEGCAFALDDFGAGLSSFTYLKALPIDYLKIDGAFVRSITTNELDCAIVESVNRVGHVVGLKTIAEFVETDEVGQRLQQIGVDYAQGFGLHRPEALLP